MDCIRSIQIINLANTNSACSIHFCDLLHVFHVHLGNSSCTQMNIQFPTIYFNIIFRSMQKDNWLTLDSLNYLKCTYSNAVTVYFLTENLHIHRLLWLLKLLKMTMQISFLFFSTRMLLPLLGLPVALRAEQRMKMKFLSNKIYCISS